MTKNTKAANKSARTMKNRRAFVARFSQRTFAVLRAIARNDEPTSTSGRREFAAFKANLTRGTYSAFVRTNKAGVFVSDKIGVTRSR